MNYGILVNRLGALYRYILIAIFLLLSIFSAKRFNMIIIIDNPVWTVSKEKVDQTCQYFNQNFYSRTPHEGHPKRREPL